LLITEDVPHAFEIFAVSVTVPLLTKDRAVVGHKEQLRLAIPVAGVMLHVTKALHGKSVIE